MAAFYCLNVISSRSIKGHITRLFSLYESTQCQFELKDLEEGRVRSTHRTVFHQRSEMGQSSVESAPVAESKRTG